MKTLLITAATLMALTGCTTSMTGLQDKVQNKAQEKTTSKVAGKLGIPSLKKEKTTKEKIADVATGKTSVEDAAVDAAADKVADAAISKVL